jgi:hypothetical protein
MFVCMYVYDMYMYANSILQTCKVYVCMYAVYVCVRIVFFIHVRYMYVCLYVCMYAVYLCMRIVSCRHARCRYVYMCSNYVM